MTLDDLNQLDSTQAQQALSNCCTSERWVNAMVDARPFASHEALQEMAITIWQDLDEEDYLQAFSGHPKIGDVNSLRKKYASTKALAANEQGGVNQASDDVLLKLANANEAYFDKHGFIFIVYATGKSAVQMLDILTARLPNDRNTEIKQAAAEQSKITALRINKLLGLTE